MVCDSRVVAVPCCGAHDIRQMELTIFIYLCSRTTGGPTIRNAILGFLDAYPTPSAVLGASNRELEECIGPLGLMEVRRKALQRMSHDFFAEVGYTLTCLFCISHHHSPCIKRSRRTCYGSARHSHKAECACGPALFSFIRESVLGHAQVGWGIAVRERDGVSFATALCWNADTMICMQAWEDPSQFHGCGKFAADSWRIFCRSQTCAKGVEDATLKRYLRWLNTGKLEAKAKVGGKPAGRRAAAKRKQDVLPPARVLRSGRRR